MAGILYFSSPLLISHCLSPLSCLLSSLWRWTFIIYHYKHWLVFTANHLNPLSSLPRKTLLWLNPITHLLWATLLQVSLASGSTLNHWPQFNSVQSLCHVRLCDDAMDCSTPGLPVHHQLPGLTQTHVHHIGDDIQPSHPLSSPSPPAFNVSQHQDLFTMNWLFASGDQSTGVSASASVLPMNIQDWLPLGWTGWVSLQPKGLSESLTPSRP